MCLPTSLLGFVRSAETSHQRGGSMAIMKKCSYPGCRKLVPITERFCAEHEAKDEEYRARAKGLREVKRLQNRGSASARGYGYRWSKVREAFLREHPLCVECMKQGRITPATDVDHIIPHRGDPELMWNPDNYQALCHSCHSRKTAREDRGFGNPRLTRIV